MKREEASIEVRIRVVANEWQETIKNDAAIDLEDLLQDLRWRYWQYQQEHSTYPHWNLMRNWARKAMRCYGYRGRDCDDFLRHEPRTVLVGDSWFVRNPSIDITDEEMLDFMAYHRTENTNRKWIPEED